MVKANHPAGPGPAPDTALRPLDRADPEVTSAGFRERFGEELDQALDLDTWHAGGDLDREYRRLEGEVREAVTRETGHQRAIREHIFPRLKKVPLPGAGVHEANLEALARIQRGLLFNGGVEACDGTICTHDTLPLTVYQVGVSLVSYRGDQGTWGQRLFRRDLRHQGPDPLRQVMDLLDRRGQRSALNRATPDDGYGELVRRALMTYAERGLLLRKSRAVWRMGHGNPVPYELLTGGGTLELMLAGTAVLRELIERHQKFVFVASEPRDLVLLTIGQALRPLEYALCNTLADQLTEWLHQGRFAARGAGQLDWDGEALPAPAWIPRFIERVASQVVVGVYRATRLAPAQLFYAHIDHADLAAHVVLADSVLQEHRGFPLLIDLAHHVCRAVFGGTLESLTGAAYAAAGAPWRYQTERTSRDP